MINKFWSSQEYVIEIKLPGFKGKTSKRYNDFLAFNEALCTKFKNLEFPDFPSKFQIVNRKETRKDKFTYLFHLIKHYAKEYKELKEKLLSILYTFLVASCKTVYIEHPEDKEGDHKSKTTGSKRQKIMNMITKGFKKGSPKKIKRRNSHDLSTSKQNLTDDDFPQMYSDKKKAQKMKFDENSMEIKRRSSEVNAIKMVADILGNEKKEDENIIIEDHFDESGSNIDENLLMQKPQQAFASLFNKEGNKNFGYVYAKFPDPNTWKKYYLKCDGPILYFYKSVKDNDFKVWYTIYK